jgi:ParB family chromosome partitioning protein
MQDYGLQQPISVRATGYRFALTSGMRRVAAARLLRWTTITAFVRSVTADEAYLLDLIENLQREDLSAEEEADAFSELIRTRGWTVQQVGESVKRSVAYVSKRVRVFDDPLLREAIASRGLPVSTAEELLAAPVGERRALIDRAVQERWDQGRARVAIRADTPEARQAADESANIRVGTTTAPKTSRGVSPVRPRGLTQAIREFHRLVLDLRLEDLTQAERSALRSLFNDLLILARAPTGPRERVFPPLPASASRRAVTKRGSRGGGKASGQGTSRGRMRTTGTDDVTRA